MTGTKRWCMFIYMVVLFVAGAITGATVFSHAPPSNPLKVNRKDEIAMKIRDKLNTSLSLTPDQQKKFEPYILRASDELEASHVDCLKRITAAIDLMHAQLTPDLTPEQKEKLKDLEAERIHSMKEKYNYSLDTGRTNTP